MRAWPRGALVKPSPQGSCPGATRANVGADTGDPGVMAGAGGRASLAERAALPPILSPEDVAVVLGLSSARAARELLLRHGVPHVRLGGRVYVLAESLVAWLRDRQERHPSREEVRARADETIRSIAPTSRARRRGRRPPILRPGEE